MEIHNRKPIYYALPALHGKAPTDGNLIVEFISPVALCHLENSRRHPRSLRNSIVRRKSTLRYPDGSSGTQGLVDHRSHCLFLARFPYLRHHFGAGFFSVFRFRPLVKWLKQNQRN